MASKYTSLRKGTETKKWSWKYLCLDTWFPEIAATIFSILCFIGIYAILKAYDQKSRPEFYYGLSLNAIISVLATSSKSSLIFVIGEAMGQFKWLWFNEKPKRLLDIQTLDSASRGPLGSITALSKKTRRSFASLGAAVIILLLAFDPFIQQIINYPTRSTAIDGSTSFAAVKKLDFFAPRLDYSAVYSKGIWSENVTISPSCSSGNCTWQNFRSVGMCSQCSDTTNSLDLKCDTNWEGPTDSEDPDSDTGDILYTRQANVVCRVGFPQASYNKTEMEFSIYASSATSWQLWGESTASWSPFQAWESSRYGVHSQPKDQPFTWPGYPLMLVAYAKLGYNGDSLGSSLKNLVDGVKVDKATQCSLEICLLEYEMSVENGASKVNKTALDYGQLFWRNSSNPEITTETLCWTPTSSPSNISIENRINGTDVQLGPHEFEFCGIAYEMELDYGFVFHGHGGRRIVRSPDDSDAKDWSKEYGDGITVRIGKLGLEKVMSNVADQINKEALSVNGSDVHGIAYATEVYVEVRWFWLILPTILMASGTIFIAIVILQNRKSGASLWKSSVLAFLYHGLYDVDKDDSSMAASVMEKKAEELVVRLKASEDGGLILQEEKKLPVV